MKRVAVNCIIALVAVLVLSLWAVNASAAQPEWVELYTDYIARIAAAPEDSRLRSFMMLADLDRDGIPELVYGVTSPLDAEVRFEVAHIAENQVVTAVPNQINGAHDLKGATLTLYRTQKSYIWMFYTQGLESPGGRKQARYTQVKYSKGTLSSSNRFTRRWTGGTVEYYVKGYGASKKAYEEKYDEYRSKIKKVGRVPQVALGNADKVPTGDALNKAIADLTARYINFAAADKARLVKSQLKLKPGKTKTVKLSISPAYASATRGTPIWSSSDPAIATVNKKGKIKAVGYGTAVISATMPNGAVARAQVKVPRPKVTRINIAAESKTMRKGEQMQLFYSFVPSAARETVRWTSADPAVAQVDEHTGMVTAMKRGTVRITCWVHKKVWRSTSITVVNGALVDEITLREPDHTLQVGEQYALSALVLPENATNKTLQWSSSNSSVASVNRAGWVVAKGAGSATISVSALGGARASTRVSVGVEGVGSRVKIENGVYELALRGGALLLSVSEHAASDRAQLQMQSDEGNANQRFLIENVGDNLVELRPLIAPEMYVAVYTDPSVEDLGPRLGLVMDPEESERRFSVTRLSNGMVAFRLASDAKTSFGADKSEDGSPVQLAPYSETNTGRRFMLTYLGEARDLPKAQSKWAQSMRDFLKEHEAELSTWTHIELADLDFNGAPELIMFTGRRNKSHSQSLSTQQALIYSAQAGEGAQLGFFEYEPDPNQDYQDAHPKVRLLIDKKSGERRWVLTDGSTGRDTGSVRYTRIRYGQGVCTAEPVLKKTWKPAANTRNGLSSERFFSEDTETTSYGYAQAYEAYFEDCKWGISSIAEIECEGRPLDQVLIDFEIAVASKNWYQ